MIEPEICACCYLRAAPERFSLTDKRPSVCVECSKHVGDAEKRDREHLRDWQTAHRDVVKSYESRLTNMRALQDRADNDVANLTSKLAEAIATITGDYHEAPIGDLRNALETQIVADERGKAESAFRLRSRAMVVIWQVDRLHNTVDVKSSEACKCGLPADRCRVLNVLRPFVGELDKWEAAEKQRMTDGKSHGLPPEHPDATRFMRDTSRPWRGLGSFQDSSSTLRIGRR